MRNIRLFLVLAMLMVMMPSCNNVKELQLTGIKGFKINSINTAGIDGDILLGIKNPNRFSFFVYKGDFDVKYSGINLGKAKLNERVKINGNSEETYAFKLSSVFKDMNLMDVMKLLNGASRQDLIEVKGEIKAGKFYYKKKFPVDLQEKINMN